MADDTWAEIARELDDPEDQQDPWETRGDPWVANVYKDLFTRRQERA
ncbi:MAG: hypothetical protein QFX32_05540 [Methanolinea sp.]|nr:hypothetical protein [Methanolinea sp.]